MSFAEFLPQLLPILILLGLVLAVIGALRRILLWRQGQESTIHWAGLFSIPQRYLVDLHHVVASDKYISNTHVATAGGFVLTALLVILIYLFDVATNILNYALLASSGLMFVGAVFVLMRRINPPPNLSLGPWSRLPYSLLIFSSSFFVLTLPASGLLPIDSGSWLLAILLVVGIIWGVGEMFFGLTWGGPMKHAFAGALHLGLHRRQDRFGGGRSTGLISIDLEKDKLGVEKPEDFKWSQLLSFDACVECGRCEKACPAFAAGQPLNPKKIIQDMVVGMAGGNTAKFAGSAYPGVELGSHKGGAVIPIVDVLLEANTLWSCTTCRACVQECPMMIEHVDAIVDMRRFETMEKGKTPGKGAEVLDNLNTTDNPNGHAPSSRMNWAADQNLAVFGSDVDRADVLLWIGDAAFDMRNQRTLRAMITLLRAAKVDFAVLGDCECDSGDLARRLGDEATFQRLAKTNIATMSQFEFKHIVTADPHAFHCLKNEYADFGGHYDVYHHTGFFADLVKNGKIKLNTNNAISLTYHDPCYLGRYNGEYDAPRYLLEAMGINVKEMERSKSKSRCCGGGGGAAVTDIPGKQRIPDMRMDDANSTGAEIVAVACPGCSQMLEGVVEPRPQVKDIAELMLDALCEEVV
ncbi:(Fe-S)-binding protein [Paraglaciecola sp. MB-3u-78]|uniref:(Fe-S)-binding protein n=1 Tax=Paraglaciecola sp. MB-3u-78 TaxID=2058332 RepID=UPI000C34A048|nr:(Fe-S)-binding protein [Paraglaciecola sp. MB-3u-78]PKG98884.1 (Fe-S)-binding protein [Paraglaciecola sp. MB-3u-78]